jgi:diacylglycerol kinase family enzyme
MYLIIHNPLSNNKKSKKTTAKIVKHLQKNDIAFNLRSTLKIDNLNDFLDNNPLITDIIYCGGDGSFNYLVNNVDVSKIKQNIHLAQSGSGNDFLRTLKPLKKANVSVGEAITNSKSASFINGCGMGVDGAICHYVNSDTKKNKFSYFVNTFKGISSFKPTSMDITVDGKNYPFEKTFFVAVQNGRYFGGGMKAAPKADVTDDLYQVIIAHTLSKMLISVLFITVYSGIHRIFKKWVTILDGKSIQITSKDPQYFQTDGEVIENVRSVTISKKISREFYAYTPKNIKQHFKKSEKNKL